MEVHLLLAGLHRGDAISNHAFALRDLLRSWGHSSSIYVRDISPGVAYECRPVSEFQRREGAITIYHYSMGFDDVTRLFLRCPGKRVLIYHNITPYQFLAPYNQAVSQACKEGRERLPELHAAADLVLGDSEYNCRELAENGFT